MKLQALDWHEHDSVELAQAHNLPAGMEAQAYLSSDGVSFTACIKADDQMTVLAERSGISTMQIAKRYAWELANAYLRSFFVGG